MHAQRGQPTRFEELGGGVTRAHGVAHRHMTHQLARAEYLSKRWLWVVLALVTVVVPVVPVLSARIPFSGENLPYLLYGLAFAVAMGVGVFTVFGFGVLVLAAPRSWALKLPAGTAVWAEFRPEAIGIGWLERFDALYLDQVLQVRRVDSVLVVQGVGDIELLIPDELVPPDIAATLLSTFKERRRVIPSYSEAARPGLRQRTGPDGVTRTRDIADAGLADELGAAVKRSVVTRLALALAILIPLVVLGYSYVEDGQLTASSVLRAAVLMVAAVGALTYVVYFATPAKFRQLVPPGAPIAAEFGPQQIGVRLGGHLQILKLDGIERVWHADHVFHVSARSLGAGLVIPDRLVPADVASGLFAQFGAA
ncbi:hypothetical protein FR943_07180 [Mycobacterium sp. TNTM28]|uniref:PH domain-containing protein n=1 Tax=[Mycobacterium] fortunisiensis TaxID=2600579 RepID=A0ABS6KJ52_9MYCO|nr:hypothetical protein [[Mycobacterium] fortunisiensis]MBU9763620.1 hypothetical protein [[Mycobacterium] fortunisiensis]